MMEPSSIRRKGHRLRWLPRGSFGVLAFGCGLGCSSGGSDAAKSPCCLCRFEQCSSVSETSQGYTQAECEHACGLPNLCGEGVSHGDLLEVQAFQCSTGPVGGPTSTIPPTDLSGMIGGQPWTLVAAETDPALSDSSGFWVSAYAESSESSCSPFTGTSPFILLTMPGEPGDFALGPSLTATFVTASGQNLVALTGHIVIDRIDATEIVGGAYVEHDVDNVVSGRFVVRICP